MEFSPPTNEARFAGGENSIQRRFALLYFES
jgi:hypothetical protein